MSLFKKDEVVTFKAHIFYVSDETIKQTVALKAAGDKQVEDKDIVARFQLSFQAKKSTNSRSLEAIAVLAFEALMDQMTPRETGVKIQEVRVFQVFKLMGNPDKN